MLSLRKLKATASVLIFTGIAASASAGFSVSDYFVDRGHDILDIFRLRAGTPESGEGYGAKARVTALAQVGYVNFDGYYAGINRRGLGVSHEDRTEGGVSLLYFSEHTMETHSGNVFLKESTDWAKLRDRRLERNLPYWDDGQGDPLGVGAEIATPILALDVGIYPTEALDFVAGIFTIDIFKDDRNTIARDPWDPMLPTTPPEPDLEASTKELREQLELQRAGFVSEEDLLEAEGAVPASQPSVDVRVQEYLESEKDQAEVEVKNEDSLDQDAVDAIIENSQAVNTTSPTAAGNAPAVQEIPSE